MRVFSSQVQTLLGAGQICCRLFARMTLASGLIGASDNDTSFSWDNGSGIGPVTFGGFGKAFVASIPPSTCLIDATSTTGQLQLSATDPTILATFLGESYRAQPIDVGILLFSTQTYQPVGELIGFRGRMDTAAVSDEPSDPKAPDKPIASTLTVMIQPLTVDLKRKGTRTRSDADQRLYRDPNDAFFQDVGLVGQTQINWDRGGPTSPAAIIGVGATG